MKLCTFISMMVILMTDQRFLTEAMSETWCSKESKDCYFILEVDYGVTMMHMAGDKELIQAKDGFLYSYKVENFTEATKFHLQADNIITADAYSEPKFVMTYNETIPGPALHMYEGQKIHLKVINKMMHESTTVHLHGQYQRGTPYSDGVPFVSQCPINPGQTFTQVFTAYPKGTFFYHGHSGPQLTNGLYGAFIVHSNTTETYDVSKLEPKSNTDTSFADYTLDEKEHVIFFQDYNHDWDANMITMKMLFGQYRDGKFIEPTKNLAGAKYSPFLVHAGLVNGRARFYDVHGNHNGGPLSVFTVKKNRFHRLRIVNSGDTHPFVVSIDSHALLVVATDGYDIDPVLVDKIVANPGERFDVVIRTKQKNGNYMIRGKTLEVDVNHRAEAILNYEGTDHDEEPVPPATVKSTTIVLNCPFSYYPKEDSTTCYNFDRIKSRKRNPDSYSTGSGFKEYFMNFAFPGNPDTGTPASVNGRSFANPPVSVVTQPDDKFRPCSRDSCGVDKVCHCPYTLTVQGDDIVQLVFTNLGGGSGWDHPVHLHGHGFQVVKIVYPTYNTSTGVFISPTDDVLCHGSYCNSATWKDPSWKNGNLTGLDLAHAPTKDNVIVPSGGYTVVRFKADNPGLWIVHCHIGLHFTDGMAALISEDKPNWPQSPEGFPTCRNYEPESESEHESTPTPQPDKAGVTRVDLSLLGMFLLIAIFCSP